MRNRKACVAVPPCSCKELPLSFSFFSPNGGRGTFSPSWWFFCTKRGFFKLKKRVIAASSHTPSLSSLRVPLFNWEPEPDYVLVLEESCSAKRLSSPGGPSWNLDDGNLPCPSFGGQQAGSVLGNDPRLVCSEAPLYPPGLNPKGGLQP